MSFSSNLRQAKDKLDTASTESEYRALINELQNYYASYFSSMSARDKQQGGQDPGDLLAQAKAKLREGSRSESVVSKVARAAQKKDRSPNGWEKVGIDEILNEVIARMSELYSRK